MNTDKVIVFCFSLELLIYFFCKMPHSVHSMESLTQVLLPHLPGKTLTVIYIYLSETCIKPKTHLKSNYLCTWFDLANVHSEAPVIFSMCLHTHQQMMHIFDLQGK